MSIKSVLSKVGKVALKAAPIAAAFIPGVGPLASMAIGAATNAASKKIEGGSWKQALMSGGIGAAEGYGAGALKAASAAGKAANAAKGIAPSASTVGKLGTVMGDVNKGLKVGMPLMSAVGGLRAASGGGSNSFAPSMNQGGGFTQSPPPPGMGGPMDRNNPNLSYGIDAGRQDALMSQPWRMGRTTGSGPVPNIYPNMGGGGGIGPSGIDPAMIQKLLAQQNGGLVPYRGMQAPA